MKVLEPGDRVFFIDLAWDGKYIPGAESWWATVIEAWQREGEYWCSLYCDDGEYLAAMGGTAHDLPTEMPEEPPPDEDVGLWAYDESSLLVPGHPLCPPDPGRPSMDEMMYLALDGLEDALASLKRLFGSCTSDWQKDLACRKIREVLPF